MKKGILFAMALSVTSLLAAPSATVQAAVPQVSVKDCSDVLSQLKQLSGDRSCLRFQTILINGDCFSLPSDCPDDTTTPDDTTKPDDTSTPDNATKPGDTSTPDNTTKPGNTTTPDDSAKPSYAQQVVDLVNAERAKNGLNPLTLDTGLTDAAQVRAKEIQSSFSHTRPNGSSFSTALKEAGVSYRRSGENIAWGQKSPETVMNAWMNSDGHRANILNKNFSRIGVGYLTNSSATPYWVQLFAD